jgi:hypothetical protein
MDQQMSTGHLTPRLWEKVYLDLEELMSELLEQPQKLGRKLLLEGLMCAVGLVQTMHLMN